jgi:hypothetical protein
MSNWMAAIEGKAFKIEGEPSSRVILPSGTKPWTPVTSEEA